jgi:hypothetical protein
MKLKDILNTNKNYNKLINLLNKGSSIKLCNNHFIIKKENDLLRIIETKNNKDLIKSFLLKNKDLKGINKKEFSNFLIKEFLLNNDIYYYVNEFVYFLDQKMYKTSYFKQCNKEYDNFHKIPNINKDLNDFKHEYFLYLKTHPFEKWDNDLYLNSILPNLKAFIEKNYKTFQPFLLLIKCDLCKNIYDIIEFIDIKNEMFIYDLYFYKELKHTKKDITNVNICTHCYNDFLNQKQLILKNVSC